MIKRFQKCENLIQKHKPAIGENQLINRIKNPNHKRSKNISKKLMHPIGVILFYLDLEAYNMYLEVFV